MPALNNAIKETRRKETQRKKTQALRLYGVINNSNATHLRNHINLRNPGSDNYSPPSRRP
jgi:uncharacterized protein YutE (UPF0331/DUF86 family)